MKKILSKLLILKKKRQTQLKLRKEKFVFPEFAMMSLCISIYEKFQFEKEKRKLKTPKREASDVVGECQTAIDSVPSTSAAAETIKPAPISKKPTEAIKTADEHSERKNDENKDDTKEKSDDKMVEKKTKPPRKSAEAESVKVREKPKEQRTPAGKSAEKREVEHSKADKFPEKSKDTPKSSDPSRKSSAPKESTEKQAEKTKSIDSSAKRQKEKEGSSSNSEKPTKSHKNLQEDERRRQKSDSKTSSVASVSKSSDIVRVDSPNSGLISDLYILRVPIQYSIFIYCCIFSFIIGVIG
jgi:hypothetical protein